MRKRLSCKFLEGVCWITSQNISACHYRSIPLAEFHGEALPVDAILEARRRMRNALENNSPCACSGCAWLEWQDWPDEHETYLFSVKLSLSQDSCCNIHCSYCFQSSWRDRYKTANNNRNCTIIPLVREILEGEHLAPTALVSFSAGEPTLREDFGEFLRLFASRSNRLQIFSNATVFSEELLAFLQRGKGFLCTSLDACDRETYIRIKKRDLFLATLANLRRYSGDWMILKYMLLPENDHEKPTDFLDLAEKLRIQKIMVDMDFMRVPTYPRELDRYAAFVHCAKDRNFTLVDRCFFEPFPAQPDLSRPLHVPPCHVQYTAEIDARLARYLGGDEGYNHYQLPYWATLLTDDRSFVGELHFLLTGEVVDSEGRLGQAARLAAFPSRFHYIEHVYKQHRASAAQWLSTPLDYALLWRVFVVLLCRQPGTEELQARKNYTLPLGLAIQQALLSLEFQTSLDLAGPGTPPLGTNREDVLLAYALLLLRHPESEAAILRAGRCPSLSHLAARLVQSDEFRRMRENPVTTRNRPYSEMTLAALRPSHDSRLYPLWLQELLDEDGTLFQLWRRKSSKLRPPEREGRALQAARTPGGVKRVLCFGAGDMAANLIPALDRTLLHIQAFIDERPERHGTVFMEAPVIGLERIAGFAFDYVLVCARPYELIKNKLLRLNIPEEKIVSCDLEAGAYQATREYTTFDACAGAFLENSPLPRRIIDREKFRGSGWFASGRAKWMRTWYPEET